MKILLGPPCSGKGTIGLGLKERNPELVFLSAGNVLREMARKPEYKFIEEGLSRGEMVATDLICEIMMKKAEEYNYKVILDGFPRNLMQANYIKNWTEKNNIKIEGIFCIQVDEALLIKRTATRNFCNICQKTSCFENFCCNQEMIKRNDDNAEILSKRLAIYNSEISLVLNCLCGPVYYIYNNEDITNTLNKIEKIFNEIDFLN